MSKDKKSRKQEEQSKKTKRPKLVRDSYTIPESEYKKLDELKAKSLALGTHVKKSELLRAGLLVLESMSESDFINAINQVERLKTGRPKS